MNLKKELWNMTDYQEYLEYLKSLGEKEYQEFSKKLTPTKYKILGIRIPIQRKIAKEIAKGNIKSFLNFCTSTYYEEINIEGFVLSYLESDEYLESYLLKIDNWATCDSFCKSLKIKDKEKYFNKIKKWLQSKNEFTVRVGLVLLLSFYVTEEYIPRILKLIDNIKREEYYINMAIAWLVAEIYIKDRTIIKYLENNNLNKFTLNKTISKICDSYRVTKEEKESLKKLRR